MISLEGTWDYAIGMNHEVVDSSGGGIEHYHLDGQGFAFNLTFRKDGTYELAAVTQSRRARVQQVDRRQRLQPPAVRPRLVLQRSK